MTMPHGATIVAADRRDPFVGDPELRGTRIVRAARRRSVRIMAERGGVRSPGAVIDVVMLPADILVSPELAASMRPSLGWRDAVELGGAA